MRKIEYSLEVGFAGCQDEGITEVQDDMTNAEIDIMIHFMALENAVSWEGDERLYDEEQWANLEFVEQYYAEIYGTWEFVTEDD